MSSVSVTTARSYNRATVTVRFLADCNVGRLARWLRALGYDAAYHPRIGDAELVGQALAEDRVLLTRDLGILQRRVVASGRVRAVLLRDDRVQEQLRQVVAELSLSTARSLSRCIECNVPLEPRPPAAVAARVPPFVRATQTRYSECPECARIYWAGSHWAHMRQALEAAGA
jgi:uncharacterized protein with PIN domain